MAVVVVGWCGRVGGVTGVAVLVFGDGVAGGGAGGGCSGGGYSGGGYSGGGGGGGGGGCSYIK